MFRDRLDQAMKRKGYTNKKLAEILNVSPSAVGDWRKGKYQPIGENITKLCQALDVEVDELFEPKITVMEPSPSYDNQQSRIIPIVNLSVQAGELSSDVNQEEYEAITLFIPRLEQERMIGMLVEGDSMAPVLMAGDIIICAPLDDLNQLRQHTIYVIETQDDERVVKYITRYSDHLILHSNDATAYPDRRVDYEQVRRAWEFRLRITPEIDRPGSGIDQRVEKMEALLRQKFPGWWREI